MPFNNISAGLHKTEKKHNWEWKKTTTTTTFFGNELHVLCMQAGVRPSLSHIAARWSEILQNHGNRCCHRNPVVLYL